MNQQLSDQPIEAIEAFESEKQSFVRKSKQEKKALRYQKVKLKIQIQKKKMLKHQSERLKALDQSQIQRLREIIKIGELKQKLALESNLEVYIDLEYEIFMQPRELRSLALQVAKLAGSNKDLPHPINIHLTNYTGAQKEEMEKQGAAYWSVHKHSETLDELLKNNQTQKEFIYLSPDAEQDIESIEPEKYKYIIGGFVDRTVKKYMSFNKASALQICSYRLPIKQYIKKQPRPLNIDTVACLLSEFYHSNDWKQSYENATSRNENLVTKLYKEQTVSKTQTDSNDNQQQEKIDQTQTIHNSA